MDCLESLMGREFSGPSLMYLSDASVHLGTPYDVVFAQQDIALSHPTMAPSAHTTRHRLPKAFEALRGPPPFT